MYYIYKNSLIFLIFFIFLYKIRFLSFCNYIITIKTIIIPRNFVIFFIVFKLNIISIFFLKSFNFLTQKFEKKIIIYLLMSFKNLIQIIFFVAVLKYLKYLVLFLNFSDFNQPIFRSKLLECIFY